MLYVAYKFCRSREGANVLSLLDVVLRETCCVTRDIQSKKKEFDCEHNIKGYNMRAKGWCHAHRTG